MNLKASVACWFALLAAVLALDNGVGRLPVLGYNTWNAFQCNIDEDLVLHTANLMKSLGLYVCLKNSPIFARPLSG
jgi:alpha-galactosidase